MVWYGEINANTEKIWGKALVEAAKNPAFLSVTL